MLNKIKFKNNNNYKIHNNIHNYNNNKIKNAIVHMESETVKLQVKFFENFFLHLNYS